MKKLFSLVAVIAMVVSLVSVAAFSASAASTKVYKFTFEGEGAESILKKGGEYVGEVVEWPEGSGNHCLRYELNAETHTGAGVHPYIWPVGIGGVLAAQGDLEDTGSELEMNVDFAYAGSTRNSYMYPFILFNDEEENYADHSSYAPGSNEFNTGTFIWSAYESGAPVNGLGNGGVCFVDEMTLEDGAYMYIDNIEFNWVGEWADLAEKPFIGYPNGTACEESDLDLGTIETDPQTEPSEQPTGSGDIITGDANGDGLVNMKDVLVLRKVLAGMTVEGYIEAAADVTADGAVNMKDVLQLRKFVAGLISAL